jgi:hydrophobic/amphiphilic exporter-1 (mainly G- bacteria), HAE1 family
MAILPEAQIRPVPSLDLGDPEIRVTTDRLRAAEAGVTNRDLGFAVSALIDGAKASDYLYEGREIDLKVMAPRSFTHRTHEIEQLPIATPSGDLVTLGSLAKIELTTGPAQINHVERRRSLIVRVAPPDTMALEEAMDRINEQILDPMRASGAFDGYRVALAGTADKLGEMLDDPAMELSAGVGNYLSADGGAV